MNSQYGESEFLFKYFNLKKDGFLIDIGAADGYRFSNSYDLIHSDGLEY